MASVYMLQFKSGGDMEDAILFTSLEAAIERLKRSYKNRVLIEFMSRDDQSDGLTMGTIYSADADGNIRKEYY